MLTWKGDMSKAFKTREAVVKVIVSVIKGDWIGRGSNRLGWLHTLRSCIKMFITDMKCPLASVSFVLVNSHTCKWREKKKKTLKQTSTNYKYLLTNHTIPYSLQFHKHDFYNSYVNNHMLMHIYTSCIFIHCTHEACAMKSS